VGKSRRDDVIEKGAEFVIGHHRTVRLTPAKVELGSGP
jgi:hypothetical protein